MVDPPVWLLVWPTEALPMKVKFGELATSSNFSWQFCEDVLATLYF